MSAQRLKLCVVPFTCIELLRGIVQSLFCDWVLPKDWIWLTHHRVGASVLQLHDECPLPCRQRPARRRAEIHTDPMPQPFYRRTNSNVARLHDAGRTNSR